MIILNHHPHQRTSNIRYLITAEYVYIVWIYLHSIDTQHTKTYLIWQHGRSPVPGNSCFPKSQKSRHWYEFMRLHENNWIMKIIYFWSEGKNDHLGLWYWGSLTFSSSQIFQSANIQLGFQSHCITLFSSDMAWYDRPSKGTKWRLNNLMG